MWRIPVFIVISVHLAWAQRLRDLESPTQVRRGDTVVIGILGGWDRWNDPERSIQKLVLKLRDVPGVHAESVGNHNLRTALQWVARSAPAHPRVIIIGQSLGGSATVELARALKKRHIPVELTVQVDSVGLHDGVIPGNVRAAVNYFQHDPLTIWGRSEIRAAEPAQTRILGNYQRRYPMFDPTLMTLESSWARKHLGGGHARMEADPGVWAEVEALVRQALTRSNFVGK